MTLPAVAVAMAGCAGAAGGLVAAGGSERDIHIYDPRTWHCVKRWMGVMRQARAPRMARKKPVPMAMPPPMNE